VDGSDKALERPNLSGDLGAWIATLSLLCSLGGIKNGLAIGSMPEELFSDAKG
jgi:hypothetical protein